MRFGEAGHDRPGGGEALEVADGGAAAQHLAGGLPPSGCSAVARSAIDDAAVQPRRTLPRDARASTSCDAGPPPATLSASTTTPMSTRNSGRRIRARQRDDDQRERRAVIGRDVDERRAAGLGA